MSETPPTDGTSPVSVAKRGRPKGRPKRADAPIVAWPEVDRLLVFGESVKDPATGQDVVRFPSLSELGARYGVSRNRVWQYSKKARCHQRREEVRLKAQERFEQKVIENRTRPAWPKAARRRRS